ncbi:hypothetical protein [Micromonospora sp. NPDC006431]|uniref:hypothetical protein n=1 Tax=Micromonospora sp. NPDC006431 TaxID=3364235 RepID=UPI0036817D01
MHGLPYRDVASAVFRFGGRAEHRVTGLIPSVPSNTFFHAPDDAAACSVRTGTPQPDRTALSEILGELESFLICRPYDDINVDDRHLAIVTQLGPAIDEYVATLTDTLRDALASADDEVLRAASSRWPVVAELATLARSAVSAGERLYVR